MFPGVGCIGRGRSSRGCSPTPGISIKMTVLNIMAMQWRDYRATCVLSLMMVAESTAPSHRQGGGLHTREEEPDRIYDLACIPLHLFKTNSIICNFESIGKLIFYRQVYIAKQIWNCLFPLKIINILMIFNIKIVMINNVKIKVINRSHEHCNWRTEWMIF